MHFWLRILSHENIISSPIITSVIVEHQNRTVSSLSPGAVIYSAQKLSTLLKNDAKFTTVYPQGIPKILSYFYAKAAYFYFRKKEKKKGWRSFFHALRLNPQQLFKAQTLSIIYRFFKPS